MARFWWIEQRARGKQSHKHVLLFIKKLLIRYFSKNVFEKSVCPIVAKALSRKSQLVIYLSHLQPKGNKNAKNLYFDFVIECLSICCKKVNNVWMPSYPGLEPSWAWGFSQWMVNGQKLILIVKEEEEGSDGSDTCHSNVFQNFKNHFHNKSTGILLGAENRKGRLSSRRELDKKFDLRQNQRPSSEE